MEEDAISMAEEGTNNNKQQAAACKNRKGASSLHRSFTHLSRALKKLHARRAHQADARGGGGGDLPPTPSSSAAASFLSGCMHNPRTQSFASGRRHRHNHEDDEHGEGGLAVNFRSLRIGPTGDGGSPPQDRYSSDGEDRDGVVPPPAPAAALDNNKAAVGGGVAVVTFSAAPYEDFRRSMREMVDAAAGAAAAAPAVDWEFMEELLFCYLHLNDRAVHGDILRAFTDTVAALRRRRRRRRRAGGRAAGGALERTAAVTTVVNRPCRRPSELINGRVRASMSL
ncbi:unnamed protein product [Urochloa humidicola]